MKVGVTGANGLVGRHVCRALTAAGHAPVALVRDPAKAADMDVAEVRALPTLGTGVDPAALTETLRDLDAVVHLAAYVHVMTGAPDQTVFDDVNVAGSRAVLDAAIAAGAKRFVYMSSVKAAGERSGAEPLTNDTPPAPEDAYGRSKLAAERALADRAQAWDGKLAILRPTFVYGWPATGNFRAVIKAVRKGLPLPLAAIRNRRDMTYVGNLADAARAALEADGIGPEPYFICDGDPVSTPDLFRRAADAFGGTARLFPVPACLLKLAGALTGKSAAVDRLTGDFRVDIAPFRRDAGWHPPYKMTDGLAETAAMAASDGDWERT